MSNLNKLIRPERQSNVNEPDSTPKSIVGHISMDDMGSNVQKESHKLNNNPSIGTTAKSNSSSKPLFEPSTLSSIEDLSYRPTTEENAEVLNQIMMEIYKKLTDSSHDTIVSATDVILEILKSDIDVSEKRKEIDQLLDTKLDDVELNDLINLSKKITDYGIKEESGDNQEEMAIVFEEEEEEEDEAIIEDTEEPEMEPTADIETNQETANEGIDSIQVIASNQQQKHSIPLNSISKEYLITKYPKISKEIIEECIIKLNDKEISSIDLYSQLKERLKDNNIVQQFIDNRWRIVFKLKYNETNDVESIKNELKELNNDDLLQEFIDLSNKKRRLSDSTTNEANELTAKQPKTEKRKPKIVDLGSFVFDQGSHLMASTKIKLPKGSYQQNKKLYDVVTVPAPEIPEEVKEARKSLVPITDLPDWAQAAFPSNETATLNVIQSKIYPMAFKSDENLLLCAPTGAGKTNVAMLTILRTIESFRTTTGQIRLNDFKMVYIAPLKALVSEQMREFERRLTANYDIVVNQLSGDSNLTKQQIMETQLLVVTPEKWDVITRKSTDTSYTNLVRLIIIDEIHLLHDERGPVLESIVTRTLRQVEDTGIPVRLVGLSATLPNYTDVARFLRVDVNKGLFFFDATYRPCPLEQQFIGIKEKKAIKKINAMNEACYEKLTECMANNHQLIIFVHSRKETYKTANWLKEKLIQEKQLDKFLSSNTGVKEILKLEAESMTNKNLQDILPSGFGIHHAGLDKSERTIVEDLFAQGHVKCLVSTATLAWGVNLPAHTVVIKGTETYNPEKGSWVQLSPQDILQMLGRAGRPRYDKSGEGVIITSQDEIQYYLAILNQQLPIESQLMNRLADTINAEIVLGTIHNLEEAVKWISYTYLYIRMLKSPALYHVGAEYDNDDELYYKRLDLAHSALVVLRNNKLIKYNEEEDGIVTSTELGKIASHFYINYETMNKYNNQLRPWLTEIDILSIFASSGEFKFIPLRQEEKLEVSKLYEKCPIPIKENPGDPLAKVNILLQVYISKLSLDGFALISDMIYITQSAGRLLRALHEICLRKNWSAVSKVTLNLCKMVEKRMWLTNSPLRQFGSSVSKEIIRATESSHLPFVSYFNLPAEALAEALNLKGNSRRVYELLQEFPKLSLSYYAQPLTHDLLKVMVEITPDWNWNPNIHGNFQDFLVFVEDCDGENILYRDKLSVQRTFEHKEMMLEFTVPVQDPVAPNYFITFINDRWLHSEYRIPLIISDLKIPRKAPSFTKINVTENKPVTDLKIQEFIDTFDFKYFNKFQTQVFDSLYNTNDNTFIGMSKGCGKTVCAELALLSHWKQNKGRVLYLSPSEEHLQRLVKVWKKKYQSIGNKNGDEEVGKDVDILTGDLAMDINKLSNNHLVLSTPEIFDFISKRWRQRKVIQAIEMVICDDVHLLGDGLQGVYYENVLARMKFIASLTEKDIRFINLSNSLENGRDFGDYMGCPKQSIYNFSPSERFHKIKEIKMQGTSFNDNKTMILNTIKPVYNFLKSNTGQGKNTIFVSSRRECIEVSLEISNFAENDKWRLLRGSYGDLEQFMEKIDDSSLKEAIKSGVGYVYSGMKRIERLIVEKLFANDILTVLVACKDTSSVTPTSNNVVILGTEEFDGKEQRYINYPVSSFLDMVGSCSDPMNQAKVLIYTKNSSMNHYSKFLNDGLPLESYYNSMIHDVFITGFSTKIFSNRQDCIDWLTFTYFYRRLQLNPSFYDVKDTSHTGVSEYLSDLVEDTVKDLSESNLIEIEEDEEAEDEEAEDEEAEDEEEEDHEIISPLNGALIASHHNVSYHTMVELNKLDNKSKLKSILEVICSAAEFESLPIRYNEETILEKLYKQIPVKSTEPDFQSPYFKTFILLQAHFSRIKLPTDLKLDLDYVLKRIMGVLNACVDTLSSEGYLNAVQAIDLCQMIVQGLWNRDSPLKQIPNVNPEMLKRCEKYNVETIYDIMSLEDEERDDVLQLEGEQLEQVAEFVNKYPNVDVSYDLDLSQEIVTNSPIEININLERDEEMDDLMVVSSVYPAEKREEWWVVIGESETKQLYAIKKTTIAKESQSLKLQFTVPDAGKHKLTVWCMCDSYLDADKEINFELEVDQGNEEEEEE